MRTPLLTLFFAMGCNSFTTVQEACLTDGSPGIEVIADPDDKAAFERSNCYRRVAKRSKAPAEEIIQQAVDAHANYLLTRTPSENHLFEFAGEAFTGHSATARLQALEYNFPSDSAVLDVMLLTDGDPGLTGDELLDFWFADPFLRGAWLQTTVLGAGVAHGNYEGVGFFGEIVQTGFQNWNIVYQVPTTAFAEVPLIYPRNGQVDVSPSFTSLTTNSPLALGQTYGYPITVTVGSRESGLTVLQASITDLGAPDGDTLPITVFDGAEGSSLPGLQNTAVIVPELPFEAGRQYQVDVKISSDQGERRVKSVFTVATDSRPLPARLAPDGLPALRYSFEHTLAPVGDAVNARH